MNIFVTGATGFVGRVVVRSLIRAGHDVTGLLFTPDKTEILDRLGASHVPGDIRMPESFSDAAREADAVIHLAFSYDDPETADRTALDALLEAARDGGPTMVVYTSGCWAVGATGDQPADEDARLSPAEIVAWLPGHERRVLDAATDDLVTAVVRPGVVYGGPGGLTARFFETAEESGAAEFVGDGSNHWSMIHREDLADLYLKLIDVRGSGIFHGVETHPVRVQAAAQAASEAAGAGGTTRSVPVEERRQTLGPLADALVLDQRLKARRSRRKLQWSPERSSFVAAAEEAFREWQRNREV